MNIKNKIGVLECGISALAFAYFYNERVSIIEKRRISRRAMVGHL